MLDIRDMEVLTALAQHGHFKRAASACGISQPAFSSRLRNLEDKLGTALVKRGNRFMGLTAEGEIALLWARRILQNAEGMRQDMTAAREGLNGRVSLGVVPTAVAFAAQVSIQLRRQHPGLTVEIRSASSDQIARELASFALDVGISYSKRLTETGLNVAHLYDETYVLVAPGTMVDSAATSIGWRQAAEIPLCLLSTDMNNRRIVDQVFADLGSSPLVALETNAYTAALVQVNAGLAGLIAPRILVENLHFQSHVRVLALVEPIVSEPIGLATVKRDVELPTIQATLAACHDVSR